MKTKPLSGDSLVAEARLIAMEYHEGQKHTFGEGSYFDMHIEPVANIIRNLGYGAIYQATGFLHDTFEDTEATEEVLLARGIPREVTHSVDLLTKRPGQTRHEYILGILTCQRAIVGKFGDSLFNLSWNTLHSLDADDKKSVTRCLNYSENIALLRPHLPNQSKPLTIPNLQSLEGVSLTDPSK